MSETGLAVDHVVQRRQIGLARIRGQVLHPVRLEAIERGLGSKNRGARRRAQRALVQAVKRGVVGRARS